MTRASFRLLPFFIARVIALVVPLLVALSPAHAGYTDPGFDRSTPRRAMSSFVLAAEAGDYAGAATVLDLRGIAANQRATRGPVLAEQLHYVLEQNLWIAPEQLSDDPQGKAVDPPKTAQIGTIRVQRADVPITLSRADEPPGNWAFSATTVGRIPRIYEEHGPGWLASRAPPSLGYRLAGVALWQWIGILGGALLAVIVGRVCAAVTQWLFARLSRRKKPADGKDVLLSALRQPSRFLFGIVAFDALLDPLSLSAAATHITSRIVGVVAIGAAGWIIIGLIGLASRFAESRAVATAASDSVTRPSFDADIRAVRTQVRVLRRVFSVAVAIIAIALALTQFDIVRNVGVSLLASAGVAGVVLGFAAQRTFGSLIAGLQLSFTQPIRIGDVVVIEKEWGTIEEITLTYVVVRIWDERRLVVPMTRFLDHPFENWTKVTPQLHGTIFLHVDWTLPIPALRAELERLVERHPLWDRRTKSVQVVNANDRTLEVRVLVSALDADALWDLRVDLRESLVAWLQQHEGGRYLPQVRLLTEGAKAVSAR